MNHSDLLTLKQLEDALGVSPMFLYRMREAGFRVRRIKGFGVCASQKAAERFARKYAQNRHEGQKFWV